MKIRMIKIFYSLFLIFGLTNCIGESFSDSYIRNDTDEDIKLIVKLDTSLTKHYGLSVAQFLDTYADDSACFKLSSNPKTFIGEYLLKSKTAVQVDGGMGSNPKTKFNFLQIIRRTDTTTYYSNKEIERAFTKDKARFYHELTVK